MFIKYQIPISKYHLIFNNFFWPHCQMISPTKYILNVCLQNISLATSFLGGLVGTKICCWQSLHDELNQNIQRPIFCIISVYSNFSKIRNGNETELVQIWKSLSTSSNHNFREFLAQEEVGGFLGNVEETKLVSKLLENLILQPSGEKNKHQHF